MKKYKFGLVLFIILIGAIFFIDKNINKKLTYEILNSLKINMTEEDVISVLGKPDKDKGSGVYYYIYFLEDEKFSEVHLIFNGHFLYKVELVNDIDREELELEVINLKEIESPVLEPGQSG